MVALSTQCCSPFTLPLDELSSLVFSLVNLLARRRAVIDNNI